uniref:Uncharacterized protein n=1 Tax=Mycena chlorophos TaxID=658473 RepID=A0ABQ0MB67_MYCCL|nr:predicted protein [Mycena chlorophos]
MPSESKAEQLKAEGNKLFLSNNFVSAAEKYTAAIALDPRNHLLYGNRAACYQAMGRPRDGLRDAIKATELDPKYSKGWFRRGTCEIALKNVPESIEAFQTALATTTSSTQQSEIQTSIRNAQGKITDPDYFSVDFLKAIARAHDMKLKLPSRSRSPSRDELCDAITQHPAFGEEPKLRLLLIPQSQTEPLQQIELVRGPDITEKIAEILGCKFVDAVMLHSQEQMAVAQGKPLGVGLGHLHQTYELWMDDMAVYQRPLNERASRLLRRPETYGPVLVQKTTMVKRNDSMIADSGDILSFERVTEQELLGEEYVRRRKEWLQYFTGELPTIVEFSPRR